MNISLVNHEYITDTLYTRFRAFCFSSLCNLSILL
nr:MAG TPA: hypothetical protein [Caudoviricetes sp.]